MPVRTAIFQQPDRCESYCLQVWERSIARILDSALGALLRVEFTTQGNEVLDFAVILLLETEAGMETIRVYDAAHGHNEMHRYSRSGGKEPGEVFHSGTLGEGMRAAITEVERGYREMIEGWKSQ